jgi:predicted RNase H-like HicB family nuclease
VTFNRRKDTVELASAPGYSLDMKTIRYVYWREEDVWLGHLEDYPDYMTQGRTIEELRENLKDILDEVTGGHIPGVRRVAKLQIA